MARYLLDTSVCIAALRLESEGIPAVLDRFWADGAAISSVTLAELAVGANKGSRQSQRRVELGLLTEHIPVLDFNADAAEHYGEIRAQLERRGTPIGPLDLLIAAHARSLKLTLLTMNLREFKRVPGLACQSWATIA